VENCFTNHDSEFPLLHLTGIICRGSITYHQLKNSNCQCDDEDTATTGCQATTEDTSMTTVKHHFTPSWGLSPPNARAVVAEGLK